MIPALHVGGAGCFKEWEVYNPLLSSSRSPGRVKLPRLQAGREGQRRGGSQQADWRRRRKTGQRGVGTLLHENKSRPRHLERSAEPSLEINYAQPAAPQPPPQTSCCQQPPRICVKVTKTREECADWTHASPGLSNSSNKSQRRASLGETSCALCQVRLRCARKFVLWDKFFVFLTQIMF